MDPVAAVVDSYARSVVWRQPPHPLAWAKKRMIFNAGVESSPTYILDKSPYHAPIFDWWHDREIEEILFHKAAQAGGSVLHNTLIAYCIENDPGPALFVEPDEALCKEFVRRRMRPALKAVFPNLVSDSQRDSDWNERGGIIGGMLIVPTWASSEVKLRSWPIRYIFGDELSAWKFDRQYALDRTAQFPTNRKAFWVTTPTVETEQSWLLRRDVFQRWSWAVPCPHCGKFIVLQMGSLKFDDCQRTDGSWDMERVERETRYACQECGALIDQWQRAEMLRAGKAVCETPERSKRQIAFRVSALDVPARGWGSTARTFLQVKNSMEALKTFVNQQLAEPWIEKRSGLKEVEVRGRFLDLPARTCPANTRVLMASADVQRGHLYVVVRAWLEDSRSVLVWCGHIEGRESPAPGLSADQTALSTANALDRFWREVMAYAWAWDEHDERIFPAVAALDSGDGMVTQLVYRFAAEHLGRVVPIKGEDKMKTLMRWVDVDNYPSLKLGLVNTSHYRDVILESYRQSINEPGAWILHRDRPDEYVRHLLSWQQVDVEPVGRNGLVKKTRREWGRVSKEPDHYLDAEIYCAAVQDNARGLRLLTGGAGDAPRVADSPPKPAMARGPQLPSWVQRSRF